MDISKHKTLLIVLIAILWIACIITGTTEHFVLGMCLGVALMFLHMISWAWQSRERSPNSFCSIPC